MNPDARRKIIRAWHWRTLLHLPVGLFSLGTAITVASLIATTVFVLWVALEADAFCCTWTAGLILYMFLYLQSQAMVNGMDAILAEVRQPGKDHWNRAVHTVRVLGLLGAISGAFFASLAGSYVYPLAVEPFLIISSGLSFFFCALRFSSDVLDTFITVIDFSWPPLLFYGVTILAAPALAAWFHDGAVVPIVVWTFSAGSWFHCSVECTARVHDHLAPVLLAPSVGTQRKGRVEHRSRSRLFIQSLLAIFVVPFLPVAALLATLLAPTEQLAPVIVGFAVGLATIWYAFPRMFWSTGKHLLVLVSGRPLFYGQAREKLESKPTVAKPLRLRGMSIRRRDLFAGCSVFIWTLTLLTQGVLIEQNMQDFGINEYDTSLQRTANNTSFVGLRFKVGDKVLMQANFTVQEGVQPATVDDEDMNPLCLATVKGVHIPELNHLAVSSYPTAISGEDHFSPALLPGWELRHRGHGPGGSPVRFYDMHSAERNLSVVVIKGTTVVGLVDWLRDVDLWIEGALFSHLAPIFLPGLTWWPNRLVASAIAAIGSIHVTPDRDRFYHVSADWEPSVTLIHRDLSWITSTTFRIGKS